LKKPAIGAEILIAPLFTTLRLFPADFDQKF
jgi:hypothetical protein